MWSSAAKKKPPPKGFAPTVFGSIGILELLVIMGIALMVLGPENFPKFAKMFARTVRDIRGYIDEAQRDIAKELQPVKKEVDSIAGANPKRYLDKLLEDDDDDTPVNVEPHPEDIDFYSPPATEPIEGGMAEHGYGAVEYGSETEGADAQPAKSPAPSEPPERLDG